MKTIKNKKMQIAVLIASLSIVQSPVFSQWTKTGSDIYYNDGNVGIGTTPPSNAKLNIYNQNLGTLVNIGNPSADAGGYTNMIFGTSADKSGYAYIFSIQKSGTAWGSLILNQHGGNVGIGTTNPTQKLSVNGTIQAKEIVVNTGWSDFVFDNNYKLRPLTEVEHFVKTNKHLPEIPSQKEVEKNGVQLGDISSKLLMKIEELTLYMIDMKKENAAMSNRMKLLEKENALLKTSIINNKK